MEQQERRIWSDAIKGLAVSLISLMTSPNGSWGRTKFSLYMYMVCVHVWNTAAAEDAKTGKRQLTL